MTRTALGLIPLASAISLLALSFAPQDADACLSATAVRTVVLGGVGDDVIALELTQHRDGDMEGSEWFFMTASMVELSFDADGAMSRSVLKAGKEVRVEAKAAKAWVQAAFDDHLAAARKKKGFVAAKLVKRVECDFLNQCGKAKLTGAGIKRGKRNVVKIATPDALTKHYDPVDDFAGWGIESLETLKVGKRKLLTVSLGVGHDMNPCDVAAGACTDTRKATTVKLKAKRTTLAHKRGLHHGREFDVVVPIL